jgi:hypothetical protein
MRMDGKNAIQNRPCKWALTKSVYFIKAMSVCENSRRGQTLKCGKIWVF